MSKADINNGQYHEDECLQRDDQNMKDSPWETQHRLDKPGQQRNEDKNQLTRVHVAEESERQRHRPGDFFDDFQQQVERDHPLAKGGQQHLFGESDRALDLDAVIHDQEEDRDGHPKGGVQVRAWDHTQVFQADDRTDQRE